MRSAHVVITEAVKHVIITQHSFSIRLPQHPTLSCILALPPSLLFPATSAMSTTIILPPRLAPALIVSIMGATILTGFSNLGTSSFDCVPIVSLIHNIYYLFRLAQRRSILKAEQGGPEVNDTWPYVALFPGQKERCYYLAGAFYVTCQWLIFGTASLFMILQSSSFASTVYYLSYWPQLVISLAVLYQAVQVVQAEDKLSCGEGHAWMCKRCRAKDSDLIAQPDTRSWTGSHPPYICFLLAASGSLSISLACFIYAHAEGSNAPGVNTQYVLLGTTILHHAYFVGHILRSRKIGHLGEAWPYTRTFPGHIMRTVYPITMMALSMISLHVTVNEAIPQGGFASLIDTTTVIIKGTLWTLQIIILSGGSFQAIRSCNAEGRAQCAKEGHAWKCSRIFCSGLPEPIALDVKEVRTLV
jgi:hypothetical protein